MNICSKSRLHRHRSDKAGHSRRNASHLRARLQRKMQSEVLMDLDLPPERHLEPDLEPASMAATKALLLKDP
jgi:hypothetical protein